ncbi:MAG: hypothetical protein GY696_12725 [Gammaproteobacteria bacterium]|nr:hypothetical protein [Gammaproteobacteria bacterium]
MGDAQQPPPIRLPIPALHAFKENPGDPTTDFRHWLTRFDLYIEMLNASLPPANALTDAQKNAYLCAHLGAEGLRTFSTNPTMAQRAQMQHQAFRQAAKDHFSPRITKAKAMWDFHRRIQEPDECVDEYLTALQTMTADCDFTDQRRWTRTS